MSPQASHFVNDRPRTYLYLPPVTPPSSPSDSDSAAGDDCPSPPDSVDYFDGMEWDVPSPPESSPPGSDNSEEESICLSPPESPSTSLVGNPSPAMSPSDADAPSPPGPESARSRTPSELDGDVPSATPPSSPTCYPLGAMPNVPESILSSSPTISFPWADIPPSLQQYFKIPYGGTVIDLASISFTPGPLCLQPVANPG